MTTSPVDHVKCWIYLSEPRAISRSNTPLIEVLLVDGPNLTSNTDWLVTLSLDILQNPGQTASLSVMALQDCQQKKNYVTQNCKLEHTLYYFIAKNNFWFPSYALTMVPNEKSSCKTKFSNVKYQNTDLSVGTLHKRTQHKFIYNVQLHVPKIFFELQLPYIPNNPNWWGFWTILMASTGIFSLTHRW